MLPEPET